MNNYLLDTQIFIWWMEDNKRLPSRLKSVIEDPLNRIFISVIIPWEIIVKVKAKKLNVPKNFAKSITDGIFEVLPVQVFHVLGLRRLPLYHKDPFDRILISQAKEEGLTLITSDEKFKRYKLSLLLASISV